MLVKKKAHCVCVCMCEIEQVDFIKSMNKICLGVLLRHNVSIFYTQNSIKPFIPYHGFIMH